MESALRTVIGQRENLEDVALAMQLTDSVSGEVATFLAVLDGAGGEAKGEIASGLGLTHISTHISCFARGRGFACSSDGREQALQDLLRDALCGANAQLLDTAAADSRLRGMATTAVCAIILHDELVIAWAGDSRCYVHTDQGLRCLTCDHSRVAELLASNALTRAEAVHHPDAHVITQYLGKKNGFAPEVQSHNLATNDLIVLCTDGLTDVLSDDSIAVETGACREGRLDLGKLADALVSRALASGTTDNTTVLCCGQALHNRPTQITGNRTQTGDYEVVLARILHQMNKE